MFFEFDSYHLSSKNKTKIDLILNQKLDSIIIIGHCDSTGSLEYNQKLSEQRANATHTYIAQKNPQLHVSELNGKSFLIPFKPNNSEENKSLNRRVELIYYVYKEPAIINTIKPEIKTSEKRIQQFKCQIIDQKNQFIPTGNITLYNENNEIVGQKGFSNGKAFINDSLPFNRVRIDGEQYFSQIIHYNTVSSYCTVRLQKIKKNSYFTFKNLGFIPNEPNLLPSAYPELEGLLKTMQNNPSLKIHIEGHTNGVNTTQSPEWHYTISQGRANSVYTYLVDNGINTSRLSFKGYGCTKMVFPHAINKAQAQENRRVEIIVKGF